MKFFVVSCLNTFQQLEDPPRLSYNIQDSKQIDLQQSKEERLLTLKEFFK